MYYFKTHPTVKYDIFGDGRMINVTNITSRLKFTNITKGLGLIYYDFIIPEGDRADMIAGRYYEDERLDWIIYFANEIHDPYYQWPMDSISFAKYITKEYSSIPVAQQSIHHYEWIVGDKHRVVLPFGGTVVANSKILKVDKDTYTTLPEDERRVVSYYEFEENMNESRRRIKLVDKDFIPTILQRLRVIYNANV